MRGQVVRGSQARQPRRHAPAVAPPHERQACRIPAPPPARAEAAVVGQAIAALMAAGKRDFQRLFQPIQPAGHRGNPHVHLVGGAASVPARAMARKMRASSQLNSAVIYFPIMENGSPFSALYRFRRDDTARHSRRQTGHPISRFSPHLNVRAPCATSLFLGYA